jgi:hypothetical protein
VNPLFVSFPQAGERTISPVFMRMAGGQFEQGLDQLKAIAEEN